MTPATDIGGEDDDMRDGHASPGGESGASSPADSIASGANSEAGEDGRTLSMRAPQRIRARTTMAARRWNQAGHLYLYSWACTWRTRLLAF